MKKRIQNAFDIRQSPMWASYMQSIGWNTKSLNNIQLYIKQFPFINVSIIKIQHPLGPIPFFQVEAIAKKHNAIAVIIEPHCISASDADFKKHGYKTHPRRYAPSATIKIDITPSLNAIFCSFSENARRNIKKAEKNEILIKPVFIKNSIPQKSYDEFDKLLRNLTNMKKFYAPNYKEDYKKMSAMKNHAFLLFAYEKNTLHEPIAAVWFGYYKNVITYIQTGITEKGYRLLANYLLVWEGIKIAKKMGMTVFDFEAIYDPRDPFANKNWKGYSEFKKRFHGETILYPPSWILYRNAFFGKINDVAHLL